jgi:hypothetical protein
LLAALTLDPHCDPRRLVAQDDIGEGADAAAAGIIPGQAADEIQQQILGQVLEISMWQMQFAVQTTRGAIGLVDQCGNVSGG